MTQGVGQALLGLLRDEGPRTRQQLAEALGVSRTSVSSEVAALERARLVADGPVAASSGGRRSTTVGLGPAVRFATVSVSESRVRAAVVDGSFSFPRPVSVDVGADQQDPRALALEALEQALGRDRDVLACGVSLAADPSGAPDAWAEDLTADLAELTGGAAVVDGAARAMARGERHHDPARSDNLVVVRLGASVTTAAYVDGVLGHGADGLAGAVGHLKVDEFGPACVCGSSGCLDSFVSIPALLDRWTAGPPSGRPADPPRPAIGAASPTLQDLVAAVAAGDPAAVQLTRDAGRRVGETLAGLVAFANPSRIVLGGPTAALGPHLLNEMRAAIYRRSPALVVTGVSVELGSPGDRSTLLGAALGAAAQAFDQVDRLA